MLRPLFYPPLLAALAALAFVACDGDADPPGQTTATDTTTDSGSPDSGTPDTTDTDQPTAASLSWILETERGSRAEPSMTLFPEDEPDAFAATPGFQVSVVATTTGVADGTDVVAERRGAEVGRAKVVMGEDGIGIARIDDFDLPDGASSIRLSVVDAEGNVIEVVRTVQVELAPCEIAVDSPVDCLTADAAPLRPGFQATVGVRRVSGSCASATLATFVGDVAGPTQNVQLSDTRSEVLVDVTSDDTPVTANVRISATATHPQSASLSRDTELARVLDLEPPTVRFVRPDAAMTVLTLAQDADADHTNGLQYAIRVAAEGVDAEGGVSLTLNSTLLTDTTMAAGVWEAEYTFTSDGSAALAARATDACGNTAVAEVAFDVFASLPRVAVMSPVDGATLFAHEDGDPATSDVYELDFEMSLTGARPAMTVSVECTESRDSEVWLSVGQTAIADPSATTVGITAALPVATLGNTPVCRAVVDWQNRARSSSIALTVALPAPRVALSSPTLNQALNSRVIGLAGTAANLNGQMIAVKVIDAQARVLASAMVGPVVADAWSGSINLEPIASVVPDGRYDIAIDAVDQYGNRASDTQTVPSVRVSLDATAPVLSVLTPDTHIDPVADVNLVDQRDDIPGYQTTVRASMTGEPSYDGALVCLASSGQPLGCRPPDASGTASWASVTLVPGPNTLTLTGHDGHGNDAAVTERQVQLVLDAPAVEILDPTGESVTTETTIPVIAQITEPTGGVPISGASVSVRVNDTLVEATFTETSPGRYATDGVAIQAGTLNRIQVIASFSGTVGASVERIVRHKQQAPTVTVAFPADGARLALSDAACVGSQIDCLTSVSVAVTALEAGSNATLTVACTGSEPTMIEANADGSDTLLFDAVTLIHGTTCTISAQATDAAGQLASSPHVSVSVDRRAPELTFASPSGSLLLFADDQRLSRPGMQAPFSATVAGVEAGQTATGHMRWLDETGQQMEAAFTHDIPADVAENSVYTIRFTDADVGSGLVDYPEGVVTLEIEVSDAFGNSNSITRITRVETDAPAAQITVPAAPVADACSDDADCGSGICENTACHVAWGAADGAVVTVNVAGVVTSQDNVRLCSDGPGGMPADTQCATEGFRQVALESSAGGVVVFDVDGIAEGVHTLIAEIQPNVDGPWVSSSDAADPATQSRAVYVDVTAPVVVSLGSPSDTEAPNGVLNIDESSDAPTRAYKIAAATDDAVEAYVVTNGLQGAAFTLTAGAATRTISLAEGANSLHLRAFDRVGNISAASGNTAFLELALSVDTTLPTLAFAAPTASPIRSGDSRDIVLNSDADGESVTLLEGEQEVGTALVANGSVTFDHDTFGALSEGTHSLAAHVSDAAGNSRRVATSPQVIEVDTIDPSVTVASPADAAALTDDADIAAEAGVQIAVTFTPAEGATSWSVSRADGCDQAGSCQEAITVANGTVAVAGSQESATITLPALTDINRFTITISVQDAVGNHAGVDRRVTLVVQDCSVSLTGPGQGEWVNASDCAVGSGCGVTFVATAAGANCAAVNALSLIEIDQAGDETMVGSTDSGSGIIQIPMADADVRTFRLDAFVDALKVADSGDVTRKVDLTAPVVSVTPSAAGDSPGAGLYGAANDTSAAAGFQLDARVQASDDNLGDGAIVSAIRTVGGAEVALTPAGVTFPVAVDAGATSYDSTLSQLTLVDLADNQVTITVRDAAGNLGTASFDAAVDTVPPAAVSLATILAADVEPRLPQVSLSWTAPGDNGVEGAATSYDVRYSHTPITDVASFDSACRADGIAHADALPAGGTSGDTQAYALHGPDPRDSSDPCKFVSDTAGTPWYFAVRAMDDAGNASPIAAADTKSSEAMKLAVTGISFSDDFSADTGLSSFATDFITAGGSVVGDLDGDGFDDFVVGFNLSNSFCVVYGSGSADDVTIDTGVGANHRCVIGTGTVVADVGANSLGALIEGLGDINGDGFADFGVSGKTATADGFVAIYLGADLRPALAQPDILVRGLDALSGAYGSFCGAGNFDGALHAPGDTATSDIAVGEPGSDRLRVIPGSPSWTPGQTTVTVDFDVAGVEQAFGVHTFEAQFSEAAWFGNRCQSAGDLLPTPGGGAAAGDLLIHQANADDSRIFVVPGRAFDPSTVSVLTDLTGAPTTEDIRSVRLRQDPNDAGNFVSGWGTSFQADSDLDGDGIVDIMVAHTARSTEVSDGKAIHIFSGALVAAASGGDLRVTTGDSEKIGRAWAGENGTVIEANVNGFFRGAAIIGDYDGWQVGGTLATPDLAIADRNATKVAFRMNHAVDGAPEFLGLFPTEEFEATNPANSGSYTAGLWVAGNIDLDGDGAPETLIGTAKRRVVVVW